MAPSTPSRSASGKTISSGAAELHQLERLGVHDRLHRLEHRLAHDLPDLGAVPSLRYRQHRLAHAGEPVFVGTEVEVDQLGDGGPSHQPPVDEATLEEGAPERGDGGTVDDRLVQVEECGLHISNGTGGSGFGLSHRDNSRTVSRTVRAWRGCGGVAVGWIARVSRLAGG